MSEKKHFMVRIVLFLYPLIGSSLYMHKNRMRDMSVGYSG